jgi:tRNA dimethylallyltransferase
MQVYKDLRILSSRPRYLEEKIIEHYLYGFLNINEEFSVGRWLELLNKTLEKIKNNNKIGILVGGTGLYIQAAIRGISPIPKIKNEIKKEGQLLIKKIGIEKFKKFLENIDPEYIYQNNDVQRLLRSYNVYFSTGKTLTEWHKMPNLGSVNRKIFSILLSSDRTNIYRNCDKRFDLMMSNGGLMEAKKIWQHNFDRNLSPLKSLGLRRLLEYFDGKLTLQEAIRTSKRDTRHYVKRQITWFKHNFNANIIINL